MKGVGVYLAYIYTYEPLYKGKKGNYWTPVCRGGDGIRNWWHVAYKLLNPCMYGGGGLSYLQKPWTDWPYQLYY